MDGGKEGEVSGVGGWVGVIDGGGFGTGGSYCRAVDLGEFCWVAVCTYCILVAGLVLRNISHEGHFNPCMCRGNLTIAKIVGISFSRLESRISSFNLLAILFEKNTTTSLSSKYIQPMPFRRPVALDICMANPNFPIVDILRNRLHPTSASKENGDPILRLRLQASIHPSDRSQGSPVKKVSHPRHNESIVGKLSSSGRNQEAAVKILPRSRENKSCRKSKTRENMLGWFYMGREKCGKKVLVKSEK